MSCTPNIIRVGDVLMYWQGRGGKPTSGWWHLFQDSAENSPLSGTQISARTGRSLPQLDIDMTAMKRILKTLVLVLFSAVNLGQISSPALAEDRNLDALDQWGQWRGPLGTGVAPRGYPPLTWGENKNIRWKTAIPGKGHSTPIVWRDRIFVTTAVAIGDTVEHSGAHAPGAHNNMQPTHRYQFQVVAVNRSDGTIRWRRTLLTGRPHESTHESGSWASHSPVTDGERLYVSFGSRGVFCVDLNGKDVWQTNFGDMQTKHGHGEGSSPALYGDTLIVNRDHEGESFVIALDKFTGKQRWRVARDEATSWSTPLIVEHDGTTQVVVAATNRVRAYDISYGDVIWECGGLSGNVVATPVAADGMVYVANSYETKAMLAIRLTSARGDITNTNAVAWTRHRDTPYVPSPLLYGERLYFLKHYQGFLTCVDAKTGKTHYGPQRLDGIRNVYASIVGAADRLYVVDRNGSMVVVKHDSRFEILSHNQLEDSFSASPAIVGNEMYLRGERFLYCISEEPAK